MSDELKILFPELVKASTMPSPSRESVEAGIYEHHEPIDFGAVNYTGLVPHLVKGIQEQEAIIEALEERIEQLEIIDEKDVEIDELSRAVEDLLRRMQALEEKKN